MSLYKTLFETQENKFKVGIIGMVFITTILAGVFYYEANAIEVTDLSELQGIIQSDTGANIELIELRVLGSEPGYTNEQSESEFTFTIASELLMEVSCSLTWEDEPPEIFQGTNEPDEFSLTIIAPNDIDTWEAGPSDTGSLSVTTGQLDYEEDEFVENYVGEWRIVVEAGPCGDHYPSFSPGIIRTRPDDGNDWTANYSYDYKGEAEVETEI